MVIFRRASQTVFAVAVAMFATPALAQPSCPLEGLNNNQLKDLATKTKPDLSALPGVALGKQTVVEAIATIEAETSTPAMIEAARAKVPAARDLCVSALNPKTAAIGNLSAHLCVALSDFVQRRDEAAKCRVDWIDFLGRKVPSRDYDSIRPLLGDAWEAKGKIQLAQQDFNGAQDSYDRARTYAVTLARLLNLAQLYERRSETALAAQTYMELSNHPDIGTRKNDVLRSWAVLVSNDKNSSVDARRTRWKALRDYQLSLGPNFKATPEANYKYAETFLSENLGSAPPSEVTIALANATDPSLPVGDAEQSKARSNAWYYRAVFAARTASTPEAWKTVAQYAGDGSAAPRAARLKCLAEIASGGGKSASDVGACPSYPSTPEQLFLSGVRILRSSQYLPVACTAELIKQNKPCSREYTAAGYAEKWLDMLRQAKRQFSDGRNIANNTDVIDWLEYGDGNSPKLLELLKAGETISQDWQTIKPGFKGCKGPVPGGLDSKAQEVFYKLDLLSCAHQ